MMRTRVDEGEIEVTITGKRRDFAALYDELHTWTPAGGWSPAAEQFFAELKDAAGRTE